MTNIRDGVKRIRTALDKIAAARGNPQQSDQAVQEAKTALDQLEQSSGGDDQDQQQQRR